MANDGDRHFFEVKGWCQLEHKLSDDCLTELQNTLRISDSRNQRVTDLSQIQAAMGKDTRFNDNISDFGYNPQPRRAVVFAKSHSSNWSLPWHQDRVITMSEKNENSDYINWSRKAGIWHCEPPLSVLANMAFIYLVFDDVSEYGGGIELCEATHELGVISATKIENAIDRERIVKPQMKRGEMLLVKALMLHRSTTNQTDLTRRALRIDITKPEFT